MSVSRVKLTLATIHIHAALLKFTVNSVRLPFVTTICDADVGGLRYV